MTIKKAQEILNSQGVKGKAFEVSGVYIWYNHINNLTGNVLKSFSYTKIN